jgi:hypothetical protein
MQRWILVAALVLVLLGGGGIFAVWKIKQQHPDFSYVPLSFSAGFTEEQREASVVEMRERLLTDAILTGVVRDCGIVSKWGLPSESAAVAELRKRVILRSGTDQINGVYTDTLQIGFEGVVSENDELQALSRRLMEDVARLIQPPPAQKTASPGPAPDF